MSKYLNKIIHKSLDLFGYKLLRSEDVINFKLDNLKLKLSNQIKYDRSLESFIIFVLKNFKNSKSQIFQDLLVDYLLSKVMVYSAR